MIRIGLGEPEKPGNVQDLIRRALKTSRCFRLESKSHKKGGVQDWSRRAFKTRRYSRWDSESLTNKDMFQREPGPQEPLKKGGLPDQTRSRRALTIKSCFGSDPVLESLKIKEAFQIQP